MKVTIITIAIVAFIYAAIIHAEKPQKLLCKGIVSNGYNIQNEKYKTFDEINIEFTYQCPIFANIRYEKCELTLLGKKIKAPILTNNLGFAVIAPSFYEVKAVFYTQSKILSLSLNDNLETADERWFKGQCI